MKSIGFILPGLGISGGIHIVLKWCEVLTGTGYRVLVMVPEAEKSSPIPFLRSQQIRFRVCSLQDGLDEQFDVLFGTWWETLALLGRYKSRAYAFLAQGLESQFYPPGAPQQEEYDVLAASGVSIVTTAHWLADHFRSVLGVEDGLVQTVLSPLDKLQWRPVRPLIERSRTTCRFIVEGPSSDPRKNVGLTIELLEKAQAEYLWVGAVTDRALVGPHCVRVLESVLYRDMPAVYSSADVLVKLSNAEGMFGPPLEMFATGGTAIVWDVLGAEEYMAHLFNSYIAPMNRASAVPEAIEAVKNSPELMARLKANALRTAAQWPDWEAGASAIAAAIEHMEPTNSVRFREHMNEFDALRRQRGGFRPASRTRQ